jgi:adenylate cyclase
VGVEIERKFLVDVSLWRPLGAGVDIRQGYLVSSQQLAVRIRIAGAEAFITVKGEASGVSRAEFEYAVPLDEAQTMLDRLCTSSIVEKTRHHEMVGGKLWEVDVFHGDNHGLVVAEIELLSEDEAFERPPWAAAELSHDPRYLNANLARTPFTKWRAE